MEAQDSFYSSDQEYFLDICRGGQLEEIKQFLSQMKQNSQFDWKWTTHNRDNFMHMLAANNLFEVYDKIIEDVKQRINMNDTFKEILNTKNSAGNTPLHYAVINNGKEMVERLLKQGANTNITNQFKRTPLNEAEDFQKFEIAELLAPSTKMDVDELKKYTQGMVLNNDSSDSESDEEQNEKQQQKSTQKLEKIQEEESQDSVPQNESVKNQESK